MERSKFTAHHSPFLTQNGKGILRSMLMMMFSSRIVCLDGFYYDDHVKSYAKDVAVSHSYSIAEAKSHLSTAVHRAETGEIVHITRRGKAVAVLLSEGAYERIAHFRGSEED